MVEREFMEQALALGALGEGAAAPNPRVGCVVVRDGRIVGRGFHRGPGSPHAEALAVAEAGERARGATIYVNLEPCAHHGRTPPCVDEIVAHGVARVVAAVQDPNPLVNGKGFDGLRRAGVRVDVGLLEAPSRRLNDPFFTRHLEGRPLVTLKAAVSLDGMIAAAHGNARWISGEPARRFAHRLRLRHDAVLVGAETVRRDDPRLTVRLAGVRAVRLRAVLAPGLDVPRDARVFDRETADAPLARVYVDDQIDATRRQRLDGRADVVAVPALQGRLDLARVLADLAGQGVQSVLVEGGGRTLAAFLDAGLVDRAALFVGRQLIGARGATPLNDAPAVARPDEGWRLVERTQLALGGDQLWLGRWARPVAG